MTDPCKAVLFARVCTGMSPDPKGVLPVMPAVAEEVQEKVVPGMSARRTTAVEANPEHTSWDKVALVMFGRALTRTVYAVGGPGQDGPDEAGRDATMLKVTAAWAAEGLPGVNEGMGAEVPLPGQPVMTGSQVAVQL